MASYMQGYAKDRFVSRINQNYLCQICFNVLREPAMCPTNQHCFCRSCITKHLENSRRCPTCADKLTVETLIEPPRLLKKFLNKSKIRCVYHDRGCQKVVKLQYIKRHEDTCGYTPTVCTNQGCDVTVNKCDLIHHQTDECQFRNSCGEMSKTDNVKTRTAKVQEERVERNTAVVKADVAEKLEVGSNEVRGLHTALVKAFDQMKEVLVEVEDRKSEIPRKKRRLGSGDKEKIIVAGGYGTDSVEMFNWHQRTWSPLQSLPQNRFGATSFVYNDHMTIVAGFFHGCSEVNVISMSIDPNPDPSIHWIGCPVKLPMKLLYHSSVLYNDHLIVTGGGFDNGTSDFIQEVQLVPPYAARTLSRMPEPRQLHSMEIFDDNLVIIGGSTTSHWQNGLSSVIQYIIKKNELKMLSPLPYEVSQMATVKWGDNIVVIGGIDKSGKALDKVIMYNVKTEQSDMLPPMISKRYGFSAVVIGNNIVAMGGMGGLKSVEAFNFDRNTWEELPEMSDVRKLSTAVVV